MPDDIESEIDLGGAGTVDAGAAGSPAPEGNGAGGTSVDAPEEFRSLAELNEAANGSSLKLNDTEKKRASIAVKRGFTSDEQIDAFINDSSQKQNGSGKSESKDKNVSGADEPDNNESDKEPESNDTDNNEPDGDEDGDVADGDIDSQLLEVIGPHLKNAESVEDAVQAVKDLAHEANRKGEFMNRAEKVGVKSIEDLERTVQTLNNIDSDISTRLQTPEGLKGLYDAFKIPVPNWMGSVAGAAGDANGNANIQQQNNTGELPPELNQYLNDIEEDGFIGAKQFKELIPALANNIQKNLEAKYETQNENFKQVGNYVSGLAKQSAKEAAFNTSIQDVREISSKFSKFDENLKMETDPLTIWRESITPDMKVKKDAHAEWPKLQHILSLRQVAIKTQMAEYSQAGVKNATPDVMAYLAKSFINNGQLSKIQEAAGKNAKKNLVSQLASKLQPSLNGKKAASREGFKAPKNNSDVRNMTKPQRAEFFARLRRGDIKVGA